MHITTIEEGSELTITAEKDKKKLEFRTKACFKINDTLVVEEIQSEENEPISLLSENVALSVVTVLENGTPFIWKDVMIKHISYMGEEYHRIAQSDNGRVTNRRGAFRVYIGQPALLQKGMNKNTIDVELKDISTSGFAVISSDEIEVTDTHSVHLMCDVKGYMINVYGTVIRKQEIPNSNRKIYGCKINRFDKTLDRFIIQYQQLKTSQKVVTLVQESEDGEVKLKDKKEDK